MKLKAVKIICTLLIASVLSTGIIALPVQNAFAEDSIQIENSITESSEIAVPYMNSVGTNGTWIKSSNGKWWYKHTDGTYTKNDWEYIDGSWYYFDSSGWMLSAQWLKWEGNWYYLNPSGVMHTGWLKDNNKWYYFTSRGIMVTRWVKLNGTWYYFEPVGGHVRTTPFTYDFRTYEFYSTGALKTTKISVNEQKQDDTNLCWAASSVMVGTYYTKSTKTQSDIVKYINNGVLDNIGASTANEIKAINFASLGTKTNGKSILIKDATLETMINYIDDNKPFIINMLWDRGGGHAVVGAGYNKYSERIWIVDPALGVTSDFYLYINLVRGGPIGSGTGHCKEIVVY